MMQNEGHIGFGWVSPAGAPISLPDLDDALIIAAGRFGDVLGGGRRPTGPERDDLPRVRGGPEAHRARRGRCAPA